MRDPGYAGGCDLAISLIFVLQNGSDMPILHDYFLLLCAVLALHRREVSKIICTVVKIN